MPERRGVHWWEGLRYLAVQHRWQQDVVEALSKLCSGEPPRKEESSEDAEG